MNLKFVSPIMGVKMPRDVCHTLEGSFVGSCKPGFVMDQYGWKLELAQNYLGESLPFLCRRSNL